MTVAETEIRGRDRGSSRRWRAEQLEMAGYGAQAATELARRLRHRSAPTRSISSPRLLGRARAADPALTGRARRLPAESCAGELPCLHPVAVERHDRPRPVHDPHVRAHAAAGDRGVLCADRLSLGAAGAATGISSSASRSGASPPGSSARGSTTTSRAGTRCRRPVVGAARRLAGRARRLGRNPLRRARRRLGRAPLGPERPAVHGRRRAGTAARAGDRPDRQLVQPGALRQADRPAVGAEDRPGAPARRGTSTTTRSTRRSSTS